MAEHYCDAIGYRNKEQNLNGCLVRVIKEEIDQEITANSIPIFAWVELAKV
jgi:hypothetical protein